MMFINPRHVDVECCDDTKGKHRGSVRQRQTDGDANGSMASSYLQRITFILLSIYLFISACLALFYYPLSILSIVIPLVVLTITICAAMNRRTEETLWFCAIASVFGAFGKVVAIIVFSSIFGFTRGIDIENRRRGMQSPQSKEAIMKKELWLTHFFIVLLAAEAIMMLMVACIRCNFKFVKKCFRFG